MITKLKPKSEFTRNVLTLMTGSTIAQAIPIAISPILTRIYTPEDFGFLALYMSILGFFSTAVTGKYELAIMLPKKDSDAFSIVILSILISLFISLLSFIVIFIFNTQITNILANKEISKWLYLLPISILLTGIYQTLNYWNSRKKRFKILAMGRVLQAGISSTSNLSFGFGGLGGSGLILSGIIGQLLGTSYLFKTIWNENKNTVSIFNKFKIIVMIKKYKKFPLITLPNSLIDSFRLSGISILISNFFTTAVLGQFSLAWRMVQMPMSLIGGSISQVFFQKLSTCNKRDLNKLIINFIIKASLVSAPLFLILYLFSPDIFQFVFGEEWKIAGEAASTMSLWLFLNFVSSPLSTIYLILNKQEIMIIFSIFYMIIPLGIIFLFHSQNFIDVLSYVTYSMSVLLLFIILVTFYLTKQISLEK